MHRGFFNKIQLIEVVAEGRYFQQSDFDYGPPYLVMGYTIAEKLSGKPERAVVRRRSKAQRQ